MQLSGSIPAIVTPMRSEEIDFVAFEKIIADLSKHSNAIVVAGSTGEGTSLTDAEKVDLIASARQTVSDGTSVIAGVAACSTNDAVQQAQAAEQAGAEALLISTPLYVKANEEGIQAHFQKLALATSIPIILYNVPSRTGCNLGAETICSLAKQGVIGGLKEAAENKDRVKDIVTATGRDFQMLCGDDIASFEMLAAGAKATVSVIANVLPAQTARAHELFLTSDSAYESEAAFAELKPLVLTLSKTINPVGIKYALALLGICRSDCRLPLTKLNHTAAIAIEQTLTAKLCRN